MVNLAMELQTLGAPQEPREHQAQGPRWGGGQIWFPFASAPPVAPVQLTCRNSLPCDPSSTLGTTCQIHLLPWQKQLNLETCFHPIQYAVTIGLVSLYFLSSFKIFLLDSFFQSQNILLRITNCYCVIIPLLHTSQN